VGIYDRDYYRQGGSGFQLRAPRTAVVTIILINVAVLIVEQFDPNLVVTTLGCHAKIDDTLTHPWMWWQLLTCGFVHAPKDVGHILWNMLTLFFLGRDVEEWYGTREFVRIYLVAIVIASLTWAICTKVFDPSEPGLMFGASGAVATVVVLYALLFPRRTLLVMFVLPLPAWLVGALMIGIDVYGAMHRGQPVAYTAHLGGAAFALAYFNFHWNLGNIVRPAVAWVKSRSRPPLKVFKPDDGPSGPVTDDEVDRILTKIHREGEQSLTAKERRVMEKASREYRRRRES
jgi:membrane associated rhomboid family serine protease